MMKQRILSGTVSSLLFCCCLRTSISLVWVSLVDESLSVCRSKGGILSHPPIETTGLTALPTIQTSNHQGCDMIQYEREEDESRDCIHMVPSIDCCYTIFYYFHCRERVQSISSCHYWLRSPPSIDTAIHTHQHDHAFTSQGTGRQRTRIYRIHIHMYTRTHSLSHLQFPSVPYPSSSIDYSVPILPMGELLNIIGLYFRNYHQLRIPLPSSMMSLLYCNCTDALC